MYSMSEHDALMASFIGLNHNMSISITSASVAIGLLDIDPAVED